MLEALAREQTPGHQDAFRFSLGGETVQVNTVWNVLDAEGAAGIEHQTAQKHRGRRQRRRVAHDGFKQRRGDAVLLHKAIGVVAGDVGAVRSDDVGRVFEPRGQKGQQARGNHEMDVDDVIRRAVETRGYAGKCGEHVGQHFVRLADGLAFAQRGHARDPDAFADLVRGQPLKGHGHHFDVVPHRGEMAAELFADRSRAAAQGRIFVI